MKTTKQYLMAARSANFALGQLASSFDWNTSPWLEGDKEVLEKVQKRMVRMLWDRKGDSYEQRLRSVGLTTLTERRQRGEMIETF